LNALLAAAAPLFAGAFVVGDVPVTWLEIVAFALAVAMVVFNIRVNALGWPLAIVSSLLYFLLFWNSRLYGDASLQVFFAFVAAWGWWQWLRGTDESGQALQVRHLGAKGRIGVLVAVAVAWPAEAIRLDAYDAPAGAGEFYERCGYEPRARVEYRDVPLIYYELVLR